MAAASHGSDETPQQRLLRERHHGLPAPATSKLLANLVSYTLANRSKHSNPVLEEAIEEA
jgi:hypothetical protein